MLGLNAYLLLPGGLGPRRRADLRSTIADPLSSLGGPHGSGHPDPDFIDPPGQQSQRTRSHSTNRSNAPCHGFHDSSRKISRPPLRTTWHGSSITAARNVANSIRNQLRRSARCSWTCPGSSGSSNAAHALSVHASDAITIYAQLLTRSLTGAFSAGAPPLSCAITFSWSQRPFASSTSSSAAAARSLVMKKK
jgi:hypothetical protein